MQLQLCLSNVHIGIFQTVHLNINVDVTSELSLQLLQHSRNALLLVKWDCVDESLL
jgi:hypothetical protein